MILIGSAAAARRERRGRAAHRNRAADARFVRARDDDVSARTEGNADGNRARAFAANFADCASEPARREAGCGVVYNPNGARGHNPGARESTYSGL